MSVLIWLLYSYSTACVLSIIYLKQCEYTFKCILSYIAHAFIF